MVRLCVGLNAPNMYAIMGEILPNGSWLWRERMRWASPTNARRVREGKFFGVWTTPERTIKTALAHVLRDLLEDEDE